MAVLGCRAVCRAAYLQLSIVIVSERRIDLHEA